MRRRCAIALAAYDPSNARVLAQVRFDVGQRDAVCWAHSGQDGGRRGAIGAAQRLHGGRKERVAFRSPTEACGRACAVRWHVCQVRNFRVLWGWRVTGVYLMI